MPSDRTYKLTASNATSTVSCDVAIDARSGSGSGGGGGGKSGNTGSLSGGSSSGGNSNNSGSGSNNTDNSSNPKPRVLGEQVTNVPVGAPNTGAGGTSSSTVPAWLGTLALLSGLVLTRVKFTG